MLIDTFAEILAPLGQRGLRYTKTDFVIRWLDRRSASYVQAMAIGRKNALSALTHLQARPPAEA
jgi:hypothetical protein